MWGKNTLDVQRFFIFCVTPTRNHNKPKRMYHEELTRTSSLHFMMKRVDRLEREKARKINYNNDSKQSKGLMVNPIYSQEHLMYVWHHYGRRRWYSSYQVIPRPFPVKKRGKSNENEWWEGVGNTCDNSKKGFALKSWRSVALFFVKDVSLDVMQSYVVNYFMGFLNCVFMKFSNSPIPYLKTASPIFLELCQESAKMTRMPDASSISVVPLFH